MRANKDAATRQDYGSKKGEGMGSDKEIDRGPMPMIKAGGSGGDKSGPTGSSRTYPKGKAPGMDARAFNPMNDKVAGYAVDGIGKGES
jgi:hypothetical protein